MSDVWAYVLLGMIALACFASLGVLIRELRRMTQAYREAARLCDKCDGDDPAN